MQMSSPARVTGGRLTDRDALANDWRHLESQADANVFLSWQWIGTWLDVYQPEVMVLRVTEGDRLIGLGLVVAFSERRHGVLVSRCLRLHQTGHHDQDQIWIEYNGFLATRGREMDVASACLRYLQQQAGWEEFILGAINAEAVEHLLGTGGLVAHVRWEAPCYGVPLDALGDKPDAYLDTLSGNTRHQIRRARRLYEICGPVVLVRPQSLDEALKVFDAIGPRHLERWGQGPDESGFANPAFVQFHRAMIESQWAACGVDLVSMYVGDDVVATFYNLLYRGQVYFYLGGLKVEADNKLKPGLLGHAMCIQEYRDAGFHYYDFMGGQERYKEQLGQWHQRLVQVSLQRERFKFRLEHAARQAKQHWQVSTGGKRR